jgi:rubrerythrin
MSASSQKAVRLALIRELETINHYQDLHDMADDPSVKQLMLHLMDEEKEHVAELTEILRRLDAEQNRYFEEGHAVEIGSGGLPSQGQRFEAPSGAPSVPQPARPAFFAPGGLTVGSMLGMTT